MSKLLIASLITCSVLWANEAHEIIKKMDENMRGTNVYTKMSIVISTKNHKRTMKMESWAQGSEKSFVKTLYPPKDRGITFLNLDNQMWQYVPKIERVIKIPASMMLQNWMGTDFTNDDLVKQSSILDDYEAKIIKREGTIAFIELVPHEDAAVVWGKIVSEVDTTTFTSRKDSFYDEENELIRIFTYAKVKKVGKYHVATHMIIKPIEKPNNVTELFIEEIEYDKKISDKYFKKSALKRFSR
jgi:outer membrane lipoprotein-sorting protein